jgi:hypothetical protein
MKKRRWMVDLLGVLGCASGAGAFWILTNALFLRCMIVARDNEDAPRTMEAFPLYLRACGRVTDFMIYPFTLIPRQFIPNSALVTLVPALVWGVFIYFAGKAVIRFVERRPTAATPSR